MEESKSQDVGCEDCLERFKNCVDSFQRVHDEYVDELKDEHAKFWRRFTSVLQKSQESIQCLQRDSNEKRGDIPGDQSPEIERIESNALQGEDAGEEDEKGDLIVDSVPRGKMVIVFTDIQGSTKIWQKDSNTMLKSLRIHNKIIKKLITKYHGYEVKTEGDSFMIAFQDLKDSINFCIESQLSLLNEKWPKELEKYDDSRKVLNKDGVTLFIGLRIRIGLHCGTPVSIEKSITTGRFDYFGPMVNRSSRIQGIAHGGEILISETVFSEISGDQEDENKNAAITIDKYFSPIEVTSLGKRSLKGFRKSQYVYRVLPQHLRERSKYFLEDINPENDRTHSAHRKLSAPPKFRPGRRRFSFGSKNKKKKRGGSILARQTSSSAILMYASSKNLHKEKKVAEEEEEGNTSNNNSNDDDAKNNPAITRLRGRRRGMRKRHSVCIMNKQGLGGILQRIKAKKNRYKFFSFRKLNMIMEKEKRKKKSRSRKRLNSFSDYQKMRMKKEKRKKKRRRKRSKSTSSLSREVCNFVNK